MIHILNYHVQKQERVLVNYVTSAKTGLYVDEIFEKLAKRIISGAELGVWRGALDRLSDR